MYQDPTCGPFEQTLGRKMYPCGEGLILIRGWLLITREEQTKGLAILFRGDDGAVFWFQPLRSVIFAMAKPFVFPSVTIP